MKREKILELIRAHNATIDAITDAELVIKPGAILKAIVIWDCFALQGANIVNIAQENGINCVYNAQNGFITIKD